MRKWLLRALYFAVVWVPLQLFWNAVFGWGDTLLANWLGISNIGDAIKLVGQLLAHWGLPAITVLLLLLLIRRELPTVWSFLDRTPPKKERITQLIPMHDALPRVYEAVEGTAIRAFIDRNFNTPDRKLRAMALYVADTEALLVGRHPPEQRLKTIDKSKLGRMQFRENGDCLAYHGDKECFIFEISIREDDVALAIAQLRRLNDEASQYLEARKMESEEESASIDYIPLTDAARVVYEEARAAKSLWALAAEESAGPNMTKGTSEQILNYMAHFIGERVRVFGKRLPSTVQEEVPDRDRKRGSYIEGGNSLSLGPTRTQSVKTFTDLCIREEDLSGLVEKVREDVLPEVPNQADDVSAALKAIKRKITYTNLVNDLQGLLKELREFLIEHDLVERPGVKPFFDKWLTQVEALLGMKTIGMFREPSAVAELRRDLEQVHLDDGFMSLRDAAQRVYAEARARDAIWAITAQHTAEPKGSADAILDVMAGLICGEVDLYGKALATTTLVLISEAKRRSDCHFSGGARTLSFVIGRDRETFTDLAIKHADVDLLLEKVRTQVTGSTPI